ncbi:MAG: hypothetical protein PWQ61_3278 [Betaproteobacteria bacterium]|nr:hypothetical protein [Betaproteobacteria bacterium]
MLIETQSPATEPRHGKDSAQRLAAIARSGYLRVGVPSRQGGDGGTLDDLFQDTVARQWLRDLQYPDLLIFRSQRLVVEAVLQTDNVGLRELVLPSLLSGETSGASAIGCPCLEAKPAGLGWRFHGRLTGVPNLQWGGYHLLLPVKVNDQVEGLMLVRSEENDVTVQPGENPELWEQASCGTVSFQKVFLRADEWLGDPPLWQTLTNTHRALGQNLSTAISR